MRVGRRGVAAYLGFVGVFLVGGAVLQARAELTEAQDELDKAVAQMPESQRTSLATDSLRERVVADEIEARLWILIATGAAALLLALLLAMGNGDPRWLGAGLIFVALIPTALLEIVAPVLALYFGGGLAQIPERYFNKPVTRR